MAIRYLYLLPRDIYLKAEEITLGLLPPIKLIAKQSFLDVTIIWDRFNVPKLMNEAVNDLRVDYCWVAIDQKNAEIALAKKSLFCILSLMVIHDGGYS